MNRRFWNQINEIQSRLIAMTTSNLKVVVELHCGGVAVERATCENQATADSWMDIKRNEWAYHTPLARISFITK